MTKKRGRPRAPKETHKVRIQLLLEPDVLALVDATAKTFGTSRSGAIGQLLKAAMLANTVEQTMVKRKPRANFVTVKLEITQEAFTVAKSLAAKSGVSPASAMAAMLMVSIQSAASPEAQEKIAASVEVLRHG